MLCACAVEVLKIPCRCVPQHGRPNVFTFPNPDGVTMIGPLIAMGKGMGTAKDHRNTPVSKLARNVVGTEGINRPCGNGNQVHRSIEVDVHQLFIDQFQVPLTGCQRGEIGAG